MPKAGKVLIVDDARFMRAVLRDILVGLWFEVVEAENGTQALEAYKAHRPRLVTMDIVLPDTDGITALKRIMEFDASAKVVVVSALGQRQLIAEALKAGAKDFIIKPFRREQVAEIAQRLVA
jgi:two-component system chemotaxis response regulator CheY